MLSPGIRINIYVAQQPMFLFYAFECKQKKKTRNESQTLCYSAFLMVNYYIFVVRLIDYKVGVSKHDSYK